MKIEIFLHIDFICQKLCVEMQVKKPLSPISAFSISYFSLLFQWKLLFLIFAFACARQFGSRLSVCNLLNVSLYWNIYEQPMNRLLVLKGQCMNGLWMPAVTEASVLHWKCFTAWSFLESFVLMKSMRYKMKTSFRLTYISAKIRFRISCGQFYGILKNSWIMRVYCVCVCVCGMCLKYQ